MNAEPWTAGAADAEEARQGLAECRARGGNLGVRAPRLDLERQPEIRVPGEEREQMVENRQPGLDVRGSAAGLHAHAAPTRIRAHALTAGHPGGEAIAVLTGPRIEIHAHTA